MVRRLFAGGKGIRTLGPAEKKRSFRGAPREFCAASTRHRAARACLSGQSDAEAGGRPRVALLCASRGTSRRVRRQRQQRTDRAAVQSCRTPSRQFDDDYLLHPRQHPWRRLSGATEPGCVRSAPMMPAGFAGGRMRRRGFPHSTVRQRAAGRESAPHPHPPQFHRTAVPRSCAVRFLGRSCAPAAVERLGTRG